MTVVTIREYSGSVQGKTFNVAKMAGVNKFLRIYYARAMDLYK